MTVRKYSKAPIVEAVIDFRFDSQLSADALAKVAKRLESSYPFKEDQVSLGVFMSPDQISFNRTPNGHKFTSLDATKIILLQPNGFTSSKLAPYESWEHLRAQTRSAVEELTKAVGNVIVSRIGTRFINRLDIPALSINIGEWVTLGVVLPRKVTDKIERFVTQFSFSSVSDVTATVTVQSENSPLIQSTSLLLDIDVMTNEKHPILSDVLWDRIEILRTEKNRIFESCITDQMREVFE